MLRANSWQKESKVNRYDRIDLYLFGLSDVGICSLKNKFMPDRKAASLVLDDREKIVKIVDVRDETKLRRYLRISQFRPHGVLFLFDITRTETFMYLIAFLEKAKPMFKSNTVRYLVGTKRDLRSGNDEPTGAEVCCHDAIMLAMKNLMKYRETSALTGEGVQGAFMSIINEVHRLGIRLENQSLLANLGSYMSLPRKGDKELMGGFDRRLSIDSDSFSEISSIGEDPEEDDEEEEQAVEFSHSASVSPALRPPKDTSKL